MVYWKFVHAVGSEIRVSDFVKCRIWDPNFGLRSPKLSVGLRTLLRALMAMPTSKIAVFGKRLFGADFGPETWLTRILFENGNGVAGTVNGERYRSMITNFFWPEMQNMDLDNLWFHQDGTTYNLALAIMDFVSTSNFRTWSSRVEATWTGHRDRLIIYIFIAQ